MHNDRTFDGLPRDHRCSHHIEVHADGWPDDVRLSDIEPKFTCTGAASVAPKIRPAFGPTKMVTD
jgi:hypothetical protein